MKSTEPGTSTSASEVTNISKHGFWLLLDDRELFLPFEEFPWFEKAPVGAIINVERPHPHHLHWPDLDVDLAVESIEHPERYPLKAKSLVSSSARPLDRIEGRGVPDGDRSAIRFTIRSRLKKSVDLRRLEDALEHLVTLFGAQAPRILPPSIEQVSQAESLIRLSSKLGQVATAPGFDRHLSSYFEGFEAAFFVTCLGSYLQDRGMIIEFEPRARKKKRSDLVATANSTKVFFECKSPEGHLSEIALDHQRIFDTLHSYISTPHTITLRFHDRLEAEDVVAIGEAIQNRLPSVREDGVFFAREGIEVGLDTTMDPAPERLNLRLTLTAPDPEDNTLLPGIIIVSHGKKMAIYGPRVEIADMLRERLRKAAKQAPTGAPFVVAISSKTLLGAPRDHRLTILEQFQPKKNTRISGVLLAEFPLTVSGGEAPSIRFIGNPYAAQPLPTSMKALLEATSNDF